MILLTTHECRELIDQHASQPILDLAAAIEALVLEKAAEKIKKMSEQTYSVVLREHAEAAQWIRAKD